MLEELWWDQAKIDYAGGSVALKAGGIERDVQAALSGDGEVVCVRDIQLLADFAGREAGTGTDLLSFSNDMLSIMLGFHWTALVSF